MRRALFESALEAAWDVAWGILALAIMCGLFVMAAYIVLAR